MDALICDGCGGDAFRVPRAMSGTITVECVGCSKTTTIELPESKATNVVKLIIPERPRPRT